MVPLFQWPTLTLNSANLTAFFVKEASCLKNSMLLEFIGLSGRTGGESACHDGGYFSGTLMQLTLLAVTDRQLKSHCMHVAYGSKVTRECGSANTLFKRFLKQRVQSEKKDRILSARHAKRLVQNYHVGPTLRYKPSQDGHPYKLLVLVDVSFHLQFVSGQTHASR